MDEVRVGDFGFPIQLNVMDVDGAFRLSSATGFIFRFRKPNGVKVDKQATFVTDGEDGKLFYLVESGLIDMPGIWQVVAVVSSLVGQWQTSPYSFEAKLAL